MNNKIKFKDLTLWIQILIVLIIFRLIWTIFVLTTWIIAFKEEGLIKEIIPGIILITIIILIIITKLVIDNKNSS